MSASCREPLRTQSSVSSQETDGATDSDDTVNSIDVDVRLTTLLDMPSIDLLRQDMRRKHHGLWHFGGPLEQQSIEQGLHVVAVHAGSVIGVLAIISHGDHVHEAVNALVHDRYASCGVFTALTQAATLRLKGRSHPADRLFIAFKQSEPHLTASFERKGYLSVAPTSLPAPLLQGCGACSRKTPIGDIEDTKQLCCSSFLELPRANWGKLPSQGKTRDGVMVSLHLDGVCCE